MKNLAGDADCDATIESELKRCGIEIVHGEKVNSEVPASITGKLGSFVFRRAWYYWTVKGNVQLVVAEELYADTVGKTDIRVAGHCGCPSPKEWAEWIHKSGKKAISSKEMSKLNKLIEKWSPERQFEATKEYLVTDNPDKDGFAQFVTFYHIDTELGLRIFVDTLKKYKLV